MAKEQKTGVKVELLCILSGGETTYNPGDVIEVDADEAERLIGLKAAKPFVPEAAAEG